MTAPEVARDGSETTGPPTVRPHFAGFEILRALSSILIVIHHAGAVAGTARTGRLHTIVEVLDIGVPVFFVTSGFLIYRPLVASRHAGRPRQGLLDFWWRRLLRVVPAYWLALTVFWATGTFTSPLGEAWWRYYLFVQVYDRLTVLGGMVQAWTLAAEVAFYLAVPVFALAVGLVVRRIRSANARFAVELGACAVLWAGAVFTRWYVMRTRDQAGQIFTWLPANMDTFAWGMAFAVLSVHLADRPGWRNLLARLAAPVWAWWAAGVAVTVWYAYEIGPALGYGHFFWQRRQLVYLTVGLLAVFPVVFGAADRGWLRRHWGRNPIPWLGAVSYGLYLWHFDLMKRAVDGYDFFNNRQTWTGILGTPSGNSNFLALLVVGFVSGFACAAASWHLLEKPLQRFKNLAARGRPAPVGALGGGGDRR